MMVKNEKVRIKFIFHCLIHNVFVWYVGNREANHLKNEVCKDENTFS